MAADGSESILPTIFRCIASSITTTRQWALRKSRLRVGREIVNCRVLAPARTFGFVQDFEGLRRMGLIRGGSLENAIVFNEDGVMNGPLRFAGRIQGGTRRSICLATLALVGPPSTGACRSV